MFVRSKCRGRAGRALIDVMLGAGLAEEVKEVVMAGVALEDGLTVGEMNGPGNMVGNMVGIMTPVDAGDGAGVIISRVTVLLCDSEGPGKGQDSWWGNW